MAGSRKALVAALAACLLAAVSARADVVTNTWISPGGGEWFAYDNVVTTSVVEDVEYVTTNVVYTNWLDGAACISTNVAYFCLSNNTSIGSIKDTTARFSGLVFRPAESGEELGEDTWLLWNSESSFYVYTTLLGYCPINVSGGTLVMGLQSVWNTYDFGPVRKEGDGTIRISSFYTEANARREFQVAEGKLIPMVKDALFWTDVRVTDPAGQFVFTNYTSTVGVGSLKSDVGGEFDLAGNEVLMGATGPGALEVSLAGTGGVSAVYSSLVVTNIQPNIVYGAREGVLRLDSRTGLAKPFAKYDFETSLTADSSGHGRDLVSDGAVTWIEDAERGGKVAHFEGTASSGGKLVATVAGQSELTGDSDYTVSLWAKTAATPVANGYPTMISIGSECIDSQILQFRFKDANCSKLLLGHWTKNGDFGDLDSPSDPTSWHHYVIMREGRRVGVWYDGVQVLNKTDMQVVFQLPETVQINIGWLSGYDNRFFCGDIDDVVIYPYAVGRVGVERLFAGKEPFVAASGEVTGDALDIPGDTKLKLELNGKIVLAGSPVIPATNIVCNGVRGSLAMPAGGTLTITGAGTYGGVLEGSNAFVKDGAGELKLTGTAKHTGGTEVKAGRLSLVNAAAQPVAFGIYDFEDEDLGHEVAGTNRRLYTQTGVERVWDEERGWVAQFPGTSEQKLESTFNSPTLVGDTDYTISVWAKPDSSGGNKGTLVSIGNEANFQEIVFRYQGASSAGTLVLTHWGTTLDFTGIPGVANPAGAWHHYVAVRSGSTYTVYCDGVQVWTQTLAHVLSIPKSKAVCIGRQVNKTDRQFKGLLDDVRIYAQALDASDVARLYAGRDPAGVERGATPDALVHVPDPVLYYAFEDSSNLGKDSAPGGAHLVKAGSGSLTQVDSPLGGKALKFGAYLQSSTFPEAIPSNGNPFTVSMWVQGSRLDHRVWVQSLKADHSPTFLCWGNPDESTIGCMLSYWHDGRMWNDVRAYVKSTDGAADLDLGNKLTTLRQAETDLMWHHLALVYSPSAGVFTYVDGEDTTVKHNGAFTYNSCRDGGVFYIGAKSTAPGVPFYGCLDEVKVFDEILNIPQLRAVMRADAGALNALPEGGDVAVDAGAVLEVNGTDESFAALTGEGTLDFTSGRLEITTTNTFAGTLSGNGTIVLPAGAELTLGTDPAGFTGYFEMAGGALVLPEGVTSVPATFLPVPLDPASSVSYPGDVEIPDGTVLAVSDGAYGPFVSTPRRIIVCGGGTVTLQSSASLGTWVIGSGSEVVDNGDGDLASRWTVTNLGANNKVRFSTSGGVFSCTVLGAGSMVIIR